MKEYNDRWSKPLVNPGFTWGEYESGRWSKEEAKKSGHDKCTCHAQLFIDANSPNVLLTTHATYCIFNR